MPLTKVRGNGIGGSGSLTLDVANDIIVDADGGDIIFKDDGTSIGRLINSSGDFVLQSDTQDKDIIFKGDDGGSTIEAMRIDMSDGGDLLIGKTSQDSGTAGHEFLDYGRAIHTVNSTTVQIINRLGNDGDAVIFQRDGTTVGSVKTFSNQTQYITTSDGRLKENIKPISDGVQKLMAMNPVTYNWKATPDEPSEQGFIAQDMQDIAPEAVSLTDGQEMMGMDYGRITPIIVSALQDALQRISKLEQKISELENG